jgi:hypothetical protein
MKGFVSSLIILLIFLTVLSLSAVFSTKFLDYRDVINRNSILDRVYYKFDSINYAVLRILYEELGIDKLEITIKEDTLNYVTFKQIVPLDLSEYKSDLDNFEKFAEQKMNETNLAVDLNLTGVKNIFPLLILPYGTTYGEIIRPFGQREIRIDPNGGLTYLNGYTMVFEVMDGDFTDVSWHPSCKPKDKNIMWNITMKGKNGVYTEVRYIGTTEAQCKFTVKTVCPGNNGFIEVRNAEYQEGGLTVRVQQQCSVLSSIALNFTDIPGKVRVVFVAPQSIKIKETLYQIEKNDTIYIY